MIEAMLQAERLLTLGMLDQAEALYQRAADADPRNAMAVVGLSRVASERGDDAAAHAHACRALDIDPQNALALRLEARLSEILAARGQPVERPAWLRGEAGPTSTAGSPRHEPEPPPESLAETAQRAAFTRNPSMADHQRRMQQEPSTSPTGTSREQLAPERPARRRGLLRRLLGR